MFALCPVPCTLSRPPVMLTLAMSPGLAVVPFPDLSISQVPPRELEEDVFEGGHPQATAPIAEAI